MARPASRIIFGGRRRAKPHRSVRRLRAPGLFLLAAALVSSPGCRSGGDATNWSPRDHAYPQLSLILAAGDEVDISFLGAPQLNAVQTIRRDGRITLRLVGDIEAAGKTPEMLQKELTRLYSSQLQLQETSIQVRSGAVVFVDGAVRQPGRLPMTRPMTALEAIMETGGFDETQAAIRRVVVIRQQNGRMRGFLIDFRDALAGRGGYPFYLEPLDIVYVSRTRIARVNQWVDQYVNRMLPRLGIGYATDGTFTMAR